VVQENTELILLKLHVYSVFVLQENTKVIPELHTYGEADVTTGNV